MKWAYPLWLVMSIFVPLLVALLLTWDEKRRIRHFAEQAIQASFWSKLIPEWSSTARLKRVLLSCVGIFFLFLSLARPQWGTREEVTHTTGLDVMIVLDVSQSMGVSDVFPNRLEKAKHWIQAFSKHLAGDRLGLVLFSGEALLACPLTTDREYLQAVLDRVSFDSVLVPGTDFATGLKVALQALERGVEDERALKTKEKKALPATAMLLISDGEDHEGAVQEVMTQMQDQQIAFFVLGVGTEKGGPVPVLDQQGKVVSFKKDRQGKPVVSPLLPQALTALASQAGGQYWKITSEESEISSVLKKLGILDRTAYSERRYTVYEDRFQWPLLLAILCFLSELTVRLRKPKVLPGLFFALLVGLELGSFSLWAGVDEVDLYYQNRQGLQSFQKGDLEKAKRHFSEAQTLDPQRPELFFNQGVTELQSNQSEKAIPLLKQAIELGGEQGSLVGPAYYNLGLAYHQQKDVSQAVQAYIKTIEWAQKNKVPSLEKAARKNLELLVQSPPPKGQCQKNKPEPSSEKKQPSEKPSESEQPDSSAQEDKNSKTKEDHKDASSESEKSSQKESTSPSEEKPTPLREKSSSQKERESTDLKKGGHFQSEKMEVQDAERVLSGLKEKEKQLQKKWDWKKGKIKQGRGTRLSAPGSEKDW